jgi:hypothetical protein
VFVFILSLAQDRLIAGIYPLGVTLPDWGAEEEI